MTPKHVLNHVAARKFYNAQRLDLKIIKRDPEMACIHDCQMTSQYCIMNCSGDVACISQCNRAEAQCISGEINDSHKQ